jgi:cytochrome c oxidase subunit IV
MSETAHSVESNGHHAGDEEHIAHPLPVPTLVITFVTLLFLTVVTVGITTFDFGYTANLLVAVAIAFVKAVLVGMYFMHLKYDTPVNGLILLGSLLCVTLFIVFSLADAQHNFEAVPRPSAIPSN